MIDPMSQNNRPQWTDLNVNVSHKKTADGISASSYYFKRYFSVLDAEIYFGNEFVEDVAHIDWQVQQNNMPLFGYNSYTYDEMARGNRIIMGTFDINFTTPKYLYQILRAAGKEEGSSITNMKAYNVPTLGKKPKVSINKGLYGETTGSKHYPKWPDTFDIDILFGQKTAVGNPVHIVLEGVVLGSCQMVLDGAAAGTPPNIMERYSFMARDIKTYADGTTQEQSAATENKDSDKKADIKSSTKSNTKNDKPKDASSKEKDKKTKSLQQKQQPKQQPKNEPKSEPKNESKDKPKPTPEPEEKPKDNPADSKPKDEGLSEAEYQDKLKKAKDTHDRIEQQIENDEKSGKTTAAGAKLRKNQLEKQYQHELDILKDEREKGKKNGK